MKSLVSRSLSTLALAACLPLGAGCTESAAPPSDLDAGASDAPVQIHEGDTLAVKVPASGRAYVKLDHLSVVTPADPATSVDWDLAFEGTDVFTNSGPSGPGEGGGFGPLSGIVDT